MNYLRQVPFLRLLIPFILGILLSLQFCIQNDRLLLVSVLFLLVLIIFQYVKGLFRERWLFGLLLSLLMILIAFCRTWSVNELNDEYHFYQYLKNENQVLIVQVTEMPIVKNEKVKLKTKVTEIGSDLNKQFFKTTGNLLVYLPVNAESKIIEYGDVLALKPKIHKITSAQNPGTFDYQNYAHFQNLHYQTFIRSKAWSKITELQHFSIVKFAFQQRVKFLKVLHKYLPDSKTFSVGAALILGYKNEMDEDIRTAYARTGAMHVLAVSGLHVGLIYLFISFIFNTFFRVKTRGGRFFRDLFCFLGIWGFALIAGLSPSVLRAATMLSIIIIGTMTGRSPNIYNSIACSAFLLLLINPFLIKSVGFQLSYFAVISIVYFQPKLAALYSCENKVLNFFLQLFYVSIAAQIGTLPLSLFYFHQFPVYFFVSGLVVVPAASLILGGGVFLFISNYVFPGLNFLFGKFLFVIISIVNEFIFFLQKLPYSIIKGIWITGLTTTLAYLSILFFIRAINSRQGRFLVVGVFTFFLLTLSTAFSKIKVINNNLLVFYDVYKESLINIISNDASILLTNNDLDEDKLKYTTESFNLSNYVGKSEVINIKGGYVNKDDINYRDKFLEFSGKTIFLLDSMPSYKGNKIEINYLFILGKPDINFAELTQLFAFDEVVFDNSNSRFLVEEWITYCRKNDLKYHYTAESGAWILKL